MIGIVLVALGTALLIYILHGLAKQVDEIEDDAAYVYRERDRAAYGSKFLNILIGRDGR